MRKKIVAIIPARGGSKSIPRKNIKMLAGKPMIAYIIKSALKVKTIDRVIVSTEDEEIAAVAKKYGAEVPFKRPAKLATDAASTLPVLQHAVQYLKTKEHYHPDYVLLLYPTSPLLSHLRIAEAIDVCLKNKADSVISGSLDWGHYWIQKPGGWVRQYPVNPRNRQQTQPLFKENGAIYLNKTSVLRSQVVAKKVQVLLMNPNENIDVDEPADWLKVEQMLKKSKR